MKIKTGTIKEKILFSRVKAKDKKAFIQAYDLYINDIYRFVFFKVNSKEEAEDLTSAVFLKTWNYINRGNPPAGGKEYKTLKSLIYKIARNCVIDHYRKSSNKNISLERNEENIDIIDEKQNIAQKTEIALDYENVEKLLPQLKDEYREVIIMRFINEMSISEISSVLEKSKGNVRVLIYRALNSLKELFNKEQK